MAGRKQLIFRTRQRALVVGYGAIILGSYALYEAYEKRGKKRPWISKLAPGP